MTATTDVAISEKSMLELASEEFNQEFNGTAVSRISTLLHFPLSPWAPWEKAGEGSNSKEQAYVFRPSPGSHFATPMLATLSHIGRGSK